MKVISDNLISAVAADEEDPDYPATNLLNGPNRIWKGTSQDAQVVVSVNANLSGFAVFATNAETMNWAVKDGVTTEASGSYTAPTRTYPDTLRAAYPIWIELDSIQSGDRTIELDFDAGSGNIIEAGTIVAGYVSEFPNPNYGLTRTIQDYSIREKLRSGEQFYRELSRVSVFSGNIVCRDTPFYSLLMGVIFRLGPTPTAWNLKAKDTITSDTIEFVVYGTIEAGASGTFDGPVARSISLTIEEAISGEPTISTGDAMGAYDIVEYDNGASSPINLSIGSLYKIIRINRTTTATVNLPAISSDTIGSWIWISKANSGQLIIKTDTGDTFLTSQGTGNTLRNTSAETGNFLLVQAEEDVWELSGSPTGSWEITTT